MTVRCLFVSLALGFAHIRTATAADSARHGPYRPHHAVPRAVVVAERTVATVVVPKGWYHPAGAPPAVLAKVIWDPSGTIGYLPSPQFSTAVTFLLDTVEKITGKRLPVVEEGTAINGLTIHIGRTQLVEKMIGRDLARLDSEGYILLSTPEALLIAGGSDYGCIFGVSALLERYAGVRWFFPGPLGEVIPKQKTLVLDKVNWLDEPDYRGREYHGMHNSNMLTDLEIEQSLDWSLHNGMRWGRYKYMHNLNVMFCTPEIAKNHPEFSPLIGGKRYVVESNPGLGWQPCVTAPGIAEEAARQIVAYFDAHPEEESFSIGVGDGDGWCECDACRKLDTPDASKNYDGFSYPGGKSRRMIWFYNRVAEIVAKKYPNKTLGFLAYWQTLGYPDGLTLHPMLMPYVTSSRHGYADPRFKRADERNLLDWASHVQKVGIYEYFNGYGFVVPHIYTHVLTDALRFGYAHGARGFTAEAWPNWGLDAPKYYATARILWNLNENPDAVLDDFCRRLFGRAAPPMKDAFQLSEQAWKAYPPIKNWFDIGIGDPAQLMGFTPSVVAQLDTDMAAARAAAPDEITRARVEFFAQCFGLIDLFAPSYEAMQLMHEHAPMKKVLQALAGTKPLRDRPQEYLKKHSLNGLQFYPQARFDAKNPNDWTSTLIQRLDVETIKAEVVARYAQELAPKAMETLRASPAKNAEEFHARLSSEIGTMLDHELGDVKSEPALAVLRDRIFAETMKVAPAFRTATPIQIDGKLDKPAWSQALRCGGFLRYPSGDPIGTKTEFSLCYNDEDLFLAMWCYQDPKEIGTNSFRAGRDVNVWADNCVELFFNRGRVGAPFFQIAINNAGAVFDDRAGNVGWDCAGLRVATGAQPNCWTVEAAIPWRSLEMNPRSDRVICFNAVRNRNVPEGSGVRQEISTWFLSQGSHNNDKNRGFILLN